eukprot:gnl/TRDRNA2_/TRDRNA2_164377_c0_seq2.p1 gnl/TRDRNA2_/TRDRNA2_164377_c0~~gnl/TRDRNA2_/TRDRNA2_164377_c0_seq2.p1  ORF type:complete len:302 (-),score=19.32 gnl/TRDRNA2_/TRDRNA2_164377_c0_seq2:300-1205(-)
MHVFCHGCGARCLLTEGRKGDPNTRHEMSWYCYGCWETFSTSESEESEAEEDTHTPAQPNDSKQNIPPPDSHRKLRVLALHCGASNANILRFQTAALRRWLGKDAEWLYPEGLEPWEPSSEPVHPSNHMAEYFAEPTETEKRLAQGSPFRTWFHLLPCQEGKNTAVDPESFERAVDWLSNYVIDHSPIDLIVSFGVVHQVLTAVEGFCQRVGMRTPWRLGLVFGSWSVINPWDVFKKRSQTPIYWVVSHVTEERRQGMQTATHSRLKSLAPQKSISNSSLQCRSIVGSVQQILLRGNILSL